jgi:hypothetical protein
VRGVLTRSRAMGLTRPGAPAAGLAEDFAIHFEDIPDEPEPGEVYGSQTPSGTVTESRPGAWYAHQSGTKDEWNQPR